MRFGRGRQLYVYVENNYLEIKIFLVLKNNSCVIASLWPFNRYKPLSLITSQIMISVSQKKKLNGSTCYFPGNEQSKLTPLSKRPIYFLFLQSQAQLFNFNISWYARKDIHLPLSFPHFMFQVNGQSNQKITGPKMNRIKQKQIGDKHKNSVDTLSCVNMLLLSI